MRRILSAFFVLTFFASAGIRNIQFSETTKDPIVLHCAQRIPTLVRFPSRIYRVYLGAPSSWIVKVINTDLVLRPKENIETGIVVELLDRTTIPLRAVVVQRKQNADDLVLVSLSKGVIIQQPPVESLKPENEAKKTEEESQQPQNSSADRSFVEKIGDYNFSYKWKNSKRVKIKAVFDDGLSTYIVYSKGSAVGAIYLKNGRKKEVVNFVIKDNVSRVDRTLLEGESFIVSYGKDRVEIKRK